MTELMLGNDVAEDEGGDAEPDDEQEAPAPTGEAFLARLHAEWPFETRGVLVSDLFVDHSYQRPVQERFVARMTDEFDETLVGAIDASVRGDGTMAILDGQQRHATMLRVGKTSCYASLYTGMTIEDEAGFFYRKNHDRKAMKGFYGFRARLVAGDIEADAVNEIVTSEGFVLGEGTDHVEKIGAIGAVEGAWRRGGGGRSECLTPTLRAIRANWRGRDRSLDASVIACLARFWASYPDEALDRASLDEALAELSPLNLIGLGKERQVMHVALPLAMAQALVDAYNRKARTAAPDRRLDPTWLGRNGGGEA